MTALKSVRSTIRKSRVFKWLALPVTSSYGRWWDLEGMTLAGARRAMGAGDVSAEEFDETGRGQAQRLSAFVSEDGRAMDLGCGMGRVLKFLAPHCGEVVGLDVSTRMLALARKYVDGADNVRFVRGKGAELSMFEDDSFDFCYSIQMFHQIEREDSMKYLTEIARVLKPGGALYLEFLDLETESNANDFKEYALESEVLRVSRRRFFTEPEVRKYAELAGLTGCDVVKEGRYLVLQRDGPEAEGSR